MGSSCVLRFLTLGLGFFLGSALGSVLGFVLGFGPGSVLSFVLGFVLGSALGFVLGFVPGSVLGFVLHLCVRVNLSGRPSFAPKPLGVSKVYLEAPREPRGPWELTSPELLGHP